MEQREVVDTSFPRGGACSGLELPNPNELPAYVDSVGRYSPE